MGNMSDKRTLPAGFIAPCLPTKTDKLPWNHFPRSRLTMRGKGVVFRTEQDFGLSLIPVSFRTETIMSGAKHIYSIANNHAQTVQVCIDRLHELGANEQLKLLT